MTLPSSPIAAPDKATFQVSARKYRPTKLSALYGQDVLVAALTNGIQQKRLPHGFIFTGIRGVGKTTTARIIARSLNCVGIDGKGVETIDPCDTCNPCTAISAGNHIDIIEMDAATHTGVDDMREIIESAQYKPVSARYKIFIIDEVHMLSKSAFNALLKTLEEPPSNVKFIFATTEIEKVPLTVLSRCMRFDLRPLKIEELKRLFTTVLTAESRTFDPESLQLIAQAAQGSARDGLSLLDQAMTMASGMISLETARQMLGAKDPTQLQDLLTHLLEGKAADAYLAYHQLIDDGACPHFILEELTGFFETINALVILGPDRADIRAWAYPQSLYSRLKDIAAQISVPIIQRLWQGALQVIKDVNGAPNPVAGGAMAITRLCYLTLLPLPADILNGTGTLGRPPTSLAPNPASPSLAPKAPAQPETPDTPVVAAAPTEATKTQASEMIKTEPTVHKTPDKKPEITPETTPSVSADHSGTFAKFMGALEAARTPLLFAKTAESVLPISCTPTGLVCTLAPDAPPGLLKELTAWSQEHYGVDYQISLGTGDTLSSWNARVAAGKTHKEATMTEAPVVKKMLETFPGAVIETVELADDA